VAGAGTARAGDVAGFGKGRAQALTGQFHQAEAADLAHLDAGTVETQRIAQAIFDFALVALVSMSMKSMTIRPPRSRRRSWRASSSAASRLVLKRVSSISAPLVERPELTSTATSASVWSMTMAPPEGRLTWRAKGGFDLVFDLEAGEQRHVVAVALDAIDVARHDGAHEGAGLLVNLVGVDQDFADFRLEVVADGANDQAAFQIDQEGADCCWAAPSMAVHSCSR
jgi:hypothetical protein